MMWCTTWDNKILKQINLTSPQFIEEPAPSQVSDIYIYITNLVCYAYFHWLFNRECQHIFGKQTGYICTFSVSLFGPQKTITTWLTKTEIFTLHWINIIIRNNKYIFTKLNAVFKLKTVVWTKQIFFSSIKN